MERALRHAIVVAAALAALAVAGPASATHNPCHNPGSNPSIDQYIEHLPTSCGATATGSGSKKVGRLGQFARNELAEAGGSDAELLQEVATSSAFGAPEKAKLSRAERTELRKRLRGVDLDDSRPLPAAIGAVSGSGDDRLLALAIAMATMAAAAVAVAVLRRRAGRREAGNRQRI